MDIILCLIALDTRRENDSKYACNKYTSNLSRSRSAQSLKLMDSTSQDDKMLILAQLFWLAVSVLESDYEYEYLLALRLLNRVLHRLPLDRPDTIDKVEKLYGQLKWASFQGVQSLLLKVISLYYKFGAQNSISIDFVQFHFRDVPTQQFTKL